MENQFYQQNKGQGFGIAGLVLGIIGVVISFIPCVGAVALLIGVTAIVFGAISLTKATNGSSQKGMGIAGVSLGSLAMVVAIFWLLLLMKIGNPAGIEEKFQHFMEWTEEFDNDVEITIDETQSLDDLEKALDELEGVVDEVKSEINDSTKEVHQEVKEALKEAKKEIEDAKEKAGKKSQ